MVSRSVFEYAVTAWWMLEQDQSQVMELLRSHHDHARVLYARAAELHPDFGLAAGIEQLTLDDAYVAELDSQFGRYGGQWHGKQLHQLVREVEESWDAPYPGTLWQTFRFVNSWSNYLLHHSAVGVAEGVHWTDPADKPVVILGPSSEWAIPSTWAAYWSYGIRVQAVLKGVDAERLESFREFFDQRACRFAVVTSEQAGGVGRNELCPCGSSLKFKRCHEPYLDA